MTLQQRQLAADGATRFARAVAVFLSLGCAALASMLLAEAAARREALFQQSVSDQKTRGDALSKRFEEALKQAQQEPITRPDRDFDLD